MKNYLRSVFIGLAVFVMYCPSYSQCTPSFTYTQGQNNVINFISTTTPSASYNYTWTFGPGSFSVGTNLSLVSHVFPGPGIYTVLLTVSAPSCTATTTQTVIVLACSLNVQTTAASGSVCNGSGSVVSLYSCAPISYSWVGVGAGPNQSNLCPGTYTVIATSSNSNCCPTMDTVVTITTSSCNLNASFTFTVQSPSVYLTNTSTGTIPGSVYSWNFGDGNAGSGPNSFHTYSTTGVFNVYLIVDNVGVPGCSDTSAVSTITISACGLTANFVTTSLGNGQFEFNSMSTGVNSSTQYTWDLGDGNFAFTDSLVHTYQQTGNYTVILTALNSATCFSTYSSVIQASVPCNLLAGFTHTVGQNGSVQFSNTSTGTSSNTTYRWLFGDGFMSNVPTPNHTYINAGTHYVTLVVSGPLNSCRDSVIQALNITGISCIADAGFTIFPIGSGPYYTIIPNYPYNVSQAVWNWGDGSSSQGVYASHTYTSTGIHNVCFNMTVSCGASDSHCMTYNFSSGGGPQFVNVTAAEPVLSISTNSGLYDRLHVYPNPCSERCRVSGLPDKPTQLYLTDMSGHLLKTLRSETSEIEIEVTNIAHGLYFLQIIAPSERKTVKILVNPD